MSAINQIQATGKRKSAIARVYLRPGSGRIVVNHRAFEDYFPMETTRNLVRQPLTLVNAGPELDILINVQGGGLEGQAGAVRHGLSRALVGLNAEFRGVLKKAGLLTGTPGSKNGRNTAAGAPAAVASIPNGNFSRRKLWASALKLVKRGKGEKGKRVYPLLSPFSLFPF